MARKLVNSMRLLLVVGIGVCGSDHGEIRASRPMRVLAGAAPVFYSHPGSHDSDRGRDYDRGE